ncbi:hypothetical protein CDAR_370941 [Caerostris darwini]|uniref:Uncharacterized protein n=1 Tax=Caerostris darwini TaxID=1538125 RepID=A0AAV4NC50_9ARAC|nr:hypothetical protein CDAR_370941 [Caerostris darwini]
MKLSLKSIQQERRSSKTDNDINEASKEKSKISLLITLSSPNPHSKQSSFKTLTQTNPCSPMKFGIRAFSSAKQQTSISFMCSLNSFLLLFPNSLKVMQYHLRILNYNSLERSEEKKKRGVMY